MAHLIKVTNTGNNEIVDYYHGEAFRFLPDEPINVPIDAMRHIFGVDFPADEGVLNSVSFRDQVFAKVIERWGWNSHDKKIIEANRKKLNALKFTPVIMKMVELVAQEEMLAPARDEKRLGRPAKAKSEFGPDVNEPNLEEEEVA